LQDAQEDRDNLVDHASVAARTTIEFQEVRSRSKMQRFMDWTNLVTNDIEEPCFCGPVGNREDQERKGVYSGDHSLVAKKRIFS
jgi:hypothetical protein